MNKQLIVDYLPFEIEPDQVNESIKENRIFFVKFVDEKLSSWEGDPVENSLEVRILPK